MRITTFVSLLLLLWAQPLLACLNESSVTATGKEVIIDGIQYLVPKGTDHAAAKTKYEQRLQTNYDVWQRTADVNAYSDYGLYLLLLGRYYEAKKVFQEIEQIAPGRYATAANIGTLYELTGQNDSALYWIKQSVKINPAAHDSSEWLHVNILEAKIKGEQYINSQFLIGTHFGIDIKPITQLSMAQLQKLGKGLYFQLKERMSFIKPQDPIVALLLFELGNITAFTKTVENAIKNYELAREYGYRDKVMENRWQLFTVMHNKVADTKLLPPRETVKSTNDANTVATTSSDAVDNQPQINEPPAETPRKIQYEIPKWLLAAALLCIVMAMAAWMYFGKKKAMP